MEPAIEVHDLRKTYPGGAEAVKGIDFEVAPGEVFGLLGPNGAGKSTTVRILATLTRPDAGRAEVAGSRQERIAIRVDLPAPLGPSRPNSSPSSTRNETPASATVRP